MIRPINIILILILSNVLAFSARSEEPANAKTAANPFDNAYQFIFFAVLEGLYRDGVSDSDVDALLLEGPTGGYMNFIYSCPLCTPALAATRTYRERPKIDTLKVPTYQTKQRTFGSGLSKSITLALRSQDRATRFKAVYEKIGGWIDYRLEHSNLTEPERDRLFTELEDRRERGTNALRAFSADGTLEIFAPGYAPGYSDSDECTICNASTQMPIKLK